MVKSRSFHLLLLSLFTLVIFSPALTAEISRIDDIHLIQYLNQIEDWSFWKLFFPGVEKGLYYRPLLMLSFYFDRALFGLDPFWMHLVNLLLHTLNVLLVYLLACQLEVALAAKRSWLPLIAAMLFAVHPLTTESVNWISGRTDLLAGVGILTCSLALLIYRQTHSWYALGFAAIAFTCGALAKETVLAFLPGTMLILWARREGQGRRQALRMRNFVIFACCVGLGMGFFLLRGFAFTSNFSKIGLTLKFIFTDLWYSGFVCLRTFGFYLKKLFFPWPLNFAILDVDPLYELLAIPLVILSLYILSRWSYLSAFFVSGLLLLTPTFLIAFNQIAWTPYAERYLYLSVALMVYPVLHFFRSICAKPSEVVLGRLTLLVVMVAFVLTSAHRSHLWQSNERLLGDTADKSPTSKVVLLEYGHVFAHKKDYQRALVQYRKAKAVSGLGYDYNPDQAIATVFVLQGEGLKAGRLFREILEKTNGNVLPVVEAYLDFVEDSLHAQGVNESQSHFVALEPFCQDKALAACYGVGVLASRRGDDERARSLLENVVENTQDDKLKNKAKDALVIMAASNR